MPPPLSDCVGRTEEVDDLATDAPLDGLAALLDHTAPPWPTGMVPPLGHWLYFLPRALQSDIAEDGHPARGGFLPPVALPRRMWAGSRVAFHHPIPRGAALRRVSTITSVREVDGRSGPLCFVTVQHEVSAAGALCVREEQDIVFRGPESAPGQPVPGQPVPRQPVPRQPALEPAYSRTVHPGPALLFRFSALTFNAHRIHYDRSYAQEVEAYPGLVVHGPLVATLLMDLFLRSHPGAAVTSFAFRGVRPLFDTGPFTLGERDTPEGAALWAADAGGYVTMEAVVG